MFTISRFKKTIAPVQKNVLLFFLAFFLSCEGTAFPAPEPEVAMRTQIENRAIEYANKKQYPEAIETFEQVLKIDPEIYTSKQLLSFLQGREKIDPVLLDLNIQGSFFQSRGKDAEAIAVFGQAMQKFSSSPYAYVKLAEIFLKKGDAHQALRILDQVLRLVKNNWFISYLQGAAYAMDSDQKMAMQCFQEAFRGNPNSADVRFALGSIYFGKRKAEAAIAVLEKVGELNSEYVYLPIVYDLLARCYLQKGDRVKAKAYYQDALASGRKIPDLQASLG